MPYPAPADHLFSQHISSLRRTVDAAMAATECDALVIGAGLQRYRFLDDQTYPFSVNPHFRAWCPLDNAPGSFLLIRSGERPVLFFHQPEDYWHKPPETPTEAWLKEFDVTVLRHPTEARSRIPAGAAFIGEPFPEMDAWGFGAINPQPLMDRLHWARAVKSEYELACLRIAAAGGDAQAG